MVGGGRWCASARRLGRGGGARDRGNTQQTDDGAKKTHQKHKTPQRTQANRTVIVDNNTWNNTHIATVGRAMASNEDDAYRIMRRLDVDYVLVIFGGLSGYSSDDINKFLWMVRCRCWLYGVCGRWRGCASCCSAVTAGGGGSAVFSEPPSHQSTSFNLAPTRPLTTPKHKQNTQQRQQQRQQQQVRIGGGVYPDHVSERDYLSDKGDYTIGPDVSPKMRDSLMYRLSYYDFGKVRARGWRGRGGWCWHVVGCVCVCTWRV